MEYICDIMNMCMKTQWRRVIAAAASGLAHALYEFPEDAVKFEAQQCLSNCMHHVAPKVRWQI